MNTDNDSVNHVRAKLFLAVERGAILYVDHQKKEAHLNWSGRPDELVPYNGASRWVEHLEHMAERSHVKNEPAPPSTELSRVVVTDKDGVARNLSDKHHPAI